MIQQVRPAVVRISTSGGTGSGVIFDTQGQTGYVITNHHVIEGASQVTVVVNDSDNYPGTVLGSDSVRDLAVVRICCGRFHKLEFGDASRLKTGDEIIAIGYALGLQGEATITRGIVSALRYDSEFRSDVIQTDAAINPGNSGGPMLSMDGKILGINTFRHEQTGTGRRVEGLNFAISGTTAQRLIPSLRTASANPTPTPTPSYRGTTAGFGPISGELRHDPDDGFIKELDAGVSMSDMVVSATFVNPYSAASGGWDYGFFIRDSGNGDSGQFIQFVVTSRGNWEVLWRKGFSNESQQIARGSTRNLNTAADGRNRLQVVALGDRGWYFINNELVSAVDISQISGVGDVAIITGSFTGNEVAGAVTRFENFQGNRLIHSYGPASGRLEYDPDYISQHRSSDWTQNLVAEAEFINPSGNDWDYGFTFRHSEANRLDVIGVTDDGVWMHQTRAVDDAGYSYINLGFIQEGNFRNKNRLLLLALGETGLFFVNEQLIAHLDLSHNLDRGYISAMGGFDRNHTGEPEFRNFNVWTAD